jgi:chemotaxis protein CheD
MENEIQIKTGELIVERDDKIIRTGSIGSCIVICIYDKEAKIGGLAHSMLPTRRDSQKVELGSVDFSPHNTSGKYADESVDNLIYGLKKIGAKIENMEAKLVGGASMFRKLMGDKNGIGFQNIESARNQLKKNGIRIDNEDTGGNSGKAITFNLKNGLVDIITTL